MLKGASAKHAAQAKMIDKALKNEADLTKSQIKKVHDKADDLPKKDFRDRYGKEKGDSVRYGVATKMVKKKLNIESILFINSTYLYYTIIITDFYANFLKKPLSYSR